MQRLRQDVKLNSLSEYSFICIDRGFFAEGFNLTDKSMEKEAGGKADKKKPMVKKKKSKAVEDEDLGFCFGDSSDEDGGNNNKEDYQISPTNFLR